MNINEIKNIKLFESIFCGNKKTVYWEIIIDKKMFIFFLNSEMIPLLTPPMKSIKVNNKIEMSIGFIFIIIYNINVIISKYII